MTNETKPRYIVDVRSARYRQYMNACVVRVLDTQTGPSHWYWVRKGIVAQWGSIKKINGFALDCRYSGPKSAFGKAIAAAKIVANQLNFMGAKNA